VGQEEQLEMLTRRNEGAQGDTEMQRQLEDAEREFSRLQAREEELKRKQVAFDEEVCFTICLCVCPDLDAVRSAPKIQH
jgi:hypothetical protein